MEVYTYNGGGGSGAGVWYIDSNALCMYAVTLIIIHSGNVLFSDILIGCFYGFDEHIYIRFDRIFTITFRNSTQKTRLKHYPYFVGKILLNSL